VTALRMTVRTHRFETGAVAFVAALAIAYGLVVAIRLVTFAIPVICFTGGAFASGCGLAQAAIDDYLGYAADWGFYAIGAIAVLPLLAGPVLGVTLIGKELDRGTTTFAWAMAPSRRRWLLQRVLPILVLMVVATLVAGAIADWLEYLRAPGIDAMATFNHLATRGPIVAAETLCFFGIALALGARFGRVLPALLIAAALSGVAFVGVTLANEAMLRTETIAIPEGSPDSPYDEGQFFGRVVETFVVNPDGEAMSWTDAYNRYGNFDEPNTGAPKLTVYLRVNPPELYGVSVARMSVLFSAIGLASITLAFVAIERRRP
jgi:ABC-type transport system involved in multi-copper enzyme maturation permease subunit